MFARMLLTAAVVFSLTAPVDAQPQPLDSEASSPFLFRIVVQCKPHPLLTPAFREGVRRDLLAALQPALGPLGTVEVIDLDEAAIGKADALVQDFASKGFPALDGARDLTGVKTHFLRVEVRDGAYHLESRQHDGFVGLASPVVRRQSTRAPELVGRVAGLMVDRDFGLAGTIDPSPGNAAEVTVRFRGGKLAAAGSLDRFVKEGDVFAVARITRTDRPAPPPVRTATGKIIAPAKGTEAPPAFTPAPHSLTLLKVLAAPQDGSARCAVLTGYQNCLAVAPKMAGYRCMKLGTVAGPVAIRLIGDDGTAASTDEVRVSATESGFPKTADSKDYLTFTDGFYRSTRPLSNVACVTVSLGKSNTKLFPVPVLGADPITLRFEVRPEAEAKALFERGALSASARAADARIAQTACFDGVSKLIKERKNEDALVRARGGYEAAEAADKVLTEEVQILKPQAGTTTGAAALLAAIDQQLAVLREVNTRLGTSIRELEKVLEKGSTKLPGQLQAQAVNTRISLLLAGGEVEEALAAYDQLLTLLPDDGTIKARKDKLAAEWKPKDDAHAKARDYLLKTWPALATIADLNESLAQLRNMVDACKKAGDRHAFRRLQGTLGGFPSKLTDLIKDLDPNADTDRNLLRDAKRIREVVSKLEQEVVDYLKANP